MKYPDGTLARLGDRVLIRNGDRGVIVASMDTGEFTPEFPQANWGHYTGVLVRTDRGALVRFEDPLPAKLLVREGSK
jgi:hypothetical protein